MATAFDVTTYPLETSTGFNSGLGTRTDRTASGGVRIRKVSSSRPALIRCEFIPLFETESDSFWGYITANEMTEFDIAHEGRTYRGYIDGETVQNSPRDGVLSVWSFDFEAVAV